MIGLRAIVSELNGEATKAGGGLSSRTIKALRAHRRRVGALGIVLFFAVLAGVTVAAYLSLRQADKVGDIKVVAGGLGLSLGAALELLRRTWKDWSQTGLLLILVEDARDDQIAVLLDKLSAKL
jgi:hypothetical protein